PSRSTGWRSRDRPAPHRTPREASPARSRGTPDRAARAQTLHGSAGRAELGVPRGHPALSRHQVTPSARARPTVRGARRDRSWARGSLFHGCRPRPIRRMLAGGSLHAMKKLALEHRAISRDGHAVGVACALAIAIVAAGCGLDTESLFGPSGGAGATSSGSA